MLGVGPLRTRRSSPSLLTLVAAWASTARASCTRCRLRSPAGADRAGSPHPLRVAGPRSGADSPSRSRGRRCIRDDRPDKLLPKAPCCPACTAATVPRRCESGAPSPGSPPWYRWRCVRVVAQHALLNGVAVIAMEAEAEVARVALFERHYRAALLHGTAVQRRRRASCSARLRESSAPAWCPASARHRDGLRFRP